MGEPMLPSTQRFIDSLMEHLDNLPEKEREERIAAGHWIAEAARELTRLRAVAEAAEKALYMWSVDNEVALRAALRALKEGR